MTSTSNGIAWSAGLFAVTLTAASALAQAPAPHRAANVCVELSGFLHKEAEQKKTEGAPAPAAATAVQAPANARPTAGGSDNPQQTSGLSGPVTHGGTGASGPQGSAQETASTAKENPKVEGKPDATAASKPPEPPKQGEAPKPPAPAAAAGPVAPEPTPQAVQEADAAIASKDQLACRGVTQKMRRAGVALPAPLLALAALDPKFYSAAPSEQEPAPAPAGGAGTNP
ncbi:MAG: hypothetical protein JWL62_3153 [Hyphomicrobiales bacterium]|nr:hypothetical protein [Hyphomicrobiales bacterium]